MYPAQPQQSYVSLQTVPHPMYIQAPNLQYFNGAGRQSTYAPPFPAVISGQQIQYATAYPPPQSQQRKYIFKKILNSMLLTFYL